MTHGRWAFQGTNAQGESGVGLDDVKDSDAGLRFLPAYGWKRAVQLARKGDSVGTQSFRAPDHNSDTLALFGSGKQKPEKSLYWAIADLIEVCVLLDDATNRRKVDADGKIVPRTGST
jgi:hypothetical protein